MVEKKQEIKVVVREPGKKSEVRAIENTLEAFQAIVGGYIESHAAPELFLHERIIAYVNEDGVAMELPPNVFTHGGHNLLRGPVVLSRIGNDGEDLGFTDAEAESIRERLDKVPQAVL